MFLGVEHSSNEIGFALLENNEVKKLEFIERESLSQTKKSIFELLGLDKKKVKLVGLTYAAGDGINAVTNIRKVKNLGQKDFTHFGFEKPVGGGTKVYKDIEESGVNAVLIPGVHSGLSCLDTFFRHYSTLCTSDKTVLTYFAFNYLKEKLSKNPNFIY